MDKLISSPLGKSSPMESYLTQASTVATSLGRRTEMMNRGSKTMEFEDVYKYPLNDHDSSLRRGGSTIKANTKRHIEIPSSMSNINFSSAEYSQLNNSDKMIKIKFTEINETPIRNKLE
jgi:hypothetical protein